MKVIDNIGIHLAMIALKFMAIMVFQVLEWISVLNDSYNMADDALNYIDCQKRAICEIWR